MNSLTKATFGLTAAGAAYVLAQKKKHALSTEASTGAEIHGFANPGYEAVRAYSVLATGGKELGLRPETLLELTAPAVPSRNGFYDECIKGEAEFLLGFMKPNRGFPFGSASSFGHPGAGGSLGLASPDAQVGYGYIPNRKSTTMGGDPRDVALRRALFSATPAAGN